MCQGVRNKGDKMQRRQFIQALAFTITLLFVFINIAAYHVIQNRFGFSIYDTQQYQKRKIMFKKNLDNQSVPHPFYGLSNQGSVVFKNSLSPEPLFERISEGMGKFDSIKVLVLGGSVAANMSYGGGRHDEYLLAKILNTHFKTDRFVVYIAAFGRGKQPQQYLKYQYLDLLGFQPNIVINIDGFNEIALPLSENQGLGNPAIFPRSYSRSLNAASADRSCAKLNNYLLNLDTGLPIAELMIWIYVQNCYHKIEDSLSAKPWWSSSIGVSDNTDYVTSSIAIWEQSSNKLNEILSSRMIDYIHVLQPNQYLEGSKPFSAEEKDNYLNFEPHAKPIRENYGKLSEKKLLTPNFRDQRFLFKDISETVYADNCCHFNQLGMEMIVNDLIISNEKIFKKYLKPLKASHEKSAPH